MASLLAFPAGPRFLVLEDRGREPGTVPPDWLDGALRFARFAGRDAAGIAAVLAAAPVRLAWWGARDRGRPDPRLAGATLVFARSDAVRAAKRREIARWRALGVAALVFLDPDDAHASVLELAIARRPAFATLRLWRRRLAAARWQDCAREGAARVLPGPALAGGTDGYALFEGASQLLPLADGAAPGPPGRYEVAAGACRFVPQRARAWPPRRHWLVRRDPAADALLDVDARAVASPGPDFVAQVETLAALPAAPAADPQRVLLLTASLYPGGAERQWCLLAAGLKALGHEVHFAVRRPLAGEFAHYLPLLREAGIAPVSLADGAGADALALAGDPGFARLHCAPGNPFGGALPALAHLLAALRPAALLAQMDAEALLAGVAGHAAGVPAIVASWRSVNPTWFPDQHASWFAPLYRALARSPRIAWANNSRGGAADYAAWLGLDPARIALVPNALDAARFPVADAAARGAARAALGLPAEVPVVLGAFRLDDVKRPFLFLEVCADLARERPDLHVLIAGVGPLEAALRARIAAARVNATLLGRRDDMARLLAAATLVLHTARIEGMPNVALEAQASGVPVVATAVGGTPDVVADGATGLLADRDDRAGLVAACRRLLDDPGLRARMGAAAAARARREFTPEAMAARYAALAAALRRAPPAAGPP